MDRHTHTHTASTVPEVSGPNSSYMLVCDGGTKRPGPQRDGKWWRCKPKKTHCLISLIYLKSAYGSNIGDLESDLVGHFWFLLILALASNVWGPQVWPIIVWTCRTRLGAEHGVTLCLPRSTAGSRCLRQHKQTSRLDEKNILGALGSPWFRDFSDAFFGPQECCHNKSRRCHLQRIVYLVTYEGLNESKNRKPTNSRSKKHEFSKEAITGRLGGERLSFQAFGWLPPQVRGTKAAKGISGASSAAKAGESLGINWY